LTVTLIMMYTLLLVNVGYYVSGAAVMSTILRISLPTAAGLAAVHRSRLAAARRTRVGVKITN
jgi:hypothetical protein